jgi:phage shock protein A
MANETLIAYQQQLKQINLDSIAIYQQTITAAQQQIVQQNSNIDYLNTQITDFEGKVTDAQAGNVLIDETIAILEE